MAKSADTDQTLHFSASDLDLRSSVCSDLYDLIFRVIAVKILYKGNSINPSLTEHDMPEEAN